MGARVYRIFAAVLIVLTLNAADAFAESVFLNNGEIFEGKIIRESDVKVVLKMTEGNKEFLRKDILRILFDEGYKTKQYLYQEDDTYIAGYIVAEDSTSYTVRKDLKDPTEMTVNKKEIVGVMSRQIKKNVTEKKEPEKTATRRPVYTPKYDPPKSGLSKTDILYFPAAGTVVFTLGGEYKGSNSETTSTTSIKSSSLYGKLGFSLSSSVSFFIYDAYTLKQNTTYNSSPAGSASGLNDPVFGAVLRLLDPVDNSIAMDFKLRYSPSLIDESTSGSDGNMARGYYMAWADGMLGIPMGAGRIAMEAGFAYCGDYASADGSAEISGRNEVYAALKAQYDLSATMSAGIGAQIKYITPKEISYALSTQEIGSMRYLSLPVDIDMMLSEKLKMNIGYTYTTFIGGSYTRKDTLLSTGISTTNTVSKTSTAHTVSLETVFYF